jgi:hypothetical protein
MISLLMVVVGFGFLEGFVPLMFVWLVLFFFEGMLWLIVEGDLWAGEFGVEASDKVWSWAF